MRFSTNEISLFRERELKTISTDATGTYLKLILHKNHINKFNLYNQVALIAISVFGHDTSDKNDDIMAHEVDSYPTKAVSKRPVQMSYILT